MAYDDPYRPEDEEEELRGALDSAWDSSDQTSSWDAQPVAAPPPSRSGGAYDDAYGDWQGAKGGGGGGGQVDTPFTNRMGMPDEEWNFGRGSPEQKELNDLYQVGQPASEDAENMGSRAPKAATPYDGAKNAWDDVKGGAGGWEAFEQSFQAMEQQPASSPTQGGAAGYSYLGPEFEANTQGGPESGADWDPNSPENNTPETAPEHGDPGREYDGPPGGGGGYTGGGTPTQTDPGGKGPPQEHTGGDGDPGVDPTQGGEDETDPGDDGEGGDDGYEERPPPEDEPADNFPGEQDGPFSKDYWTGFSDKFSEGLQWDIPTVSAGTPRGENPEVDAFQQYLMDQARKHMENPSRYDADLVKQGMDVVNAQIDEMRRTGSSAIDARMAQRGLAGSSLESEQHQLHEAALDRTANERAFALNQDQARTWAQDRNSAFDMGLGAGQQAMTRDNQLMSQDVQNRALELQAQGMNQDSAIRQAQLDFQMQESAARMGLDREAMLMDQDFRNRELDLKEKGLDDNEARWQAEMDWQKEQFGLNNDYRWAGLDQQQWGDMMNIAMWLMEQDDFDGQSIGDAFAWIEKNGLMPNPGAAG